MYCKNTNTGELRKNRYNFAPGAAYNTFFDSPCRPGNHPLLCLFSTMIEEQTIYTLYIIIKNKKNTLYIYKPLITTSKNI